MSNKITFTELVSEVADANQISKEVSNEFITKLIDYVLDETRNNGKSAITNFGSFNVVDVAARTGINPRTGEEIVIPEHKRLSFTPYKALEKSVNKEFGHLEAEVVSGENVKTGTSQVEEEPEIEETKLSQDEDPFADLLNEEETEALAEESVVEESSEEESTKEGKTAYTYPRTPERKSTNLSPIAIIGVLLVLAIVVLGVWYFTMGDQAPLEASATSVQETPTTTQDESSSESGIDEMEVYDEESRVIPMVQDDIDLSEVPNESRTIESSTPITQDIPATFVTTYSVNTGVWIYEIARQTYGNTRLWPLIFQANYTTSNNPDLILPNIVLNIPELEGTSENPSSGDYQRLADAARYVAEAYEIAGNANQTEAYLKAAVWYESMQ